MTSHTLLRPDDAEIVWYDEGVADGPPVMMVMGLGYPADMWYRTVPALADQYRVLRVDNRGAGRTGDVPGGPYPVELMAADALAVLDAAGVDKAHVVGISMGGLIAQELALSFPERVRSLVLMATHAGAAHAVWDPEAVEFLGSRGPLTPREAAEVSVRFNYAADTPRDELEKDWAIRLPLAATPQGYVQQLVGSSTWVGLERLPQLSVPTLVLHGELDRLIPAENGRMLAGLIPGAELAMVKGANHLLTTDRQDEVNALLLDWLSRNLND